MKIMNSTKPPISDSLPDFKFPEFEEYFLSNGIKVILYRDEQNPLTGIRYFVRKGAFADKISGISGFAANMMTLGTTNKSASEIAEELESRGISLSTASGWESFSATLYFLPENYAAAMSIFSEVMFNPAFADEEVARQKKRTLSALMQDRSNPSYKAQYAWNKVYFNGHPYGSTSGGTIKSVSEFTPADCRRWFKGLKNYEKMIIVSGYFDKELMLEHLENIFGIIPANKYGAIKGLRHKPDRQIKLVLSEKKDAEQAVIRIGKPSVSRKDRNYPLLQLANTIFGGYFLSRLNELLREKLGYTYGVNSALQTRKYSDSLLIATSVNIDKASDTVKRTMEEMQKFSVERLSAEELNRSRQYVAGFFVRSLETAHQIANMIGMQQINGLGSDYYDNFFEIIKTAVPEDLSKVQKKVFRPDSLTISCNGSLAKLEKQFRNFPEVIIYRSAEELFGE